MKTFDIKERSYIYSLDLINFIDNLNKKSFSTDIIAKQLIRSGTSIGANVAEAQSGSSKKDFTNFLKYALKSANESIFWLKLIRDSKKASPESVLPLLQETTELAKIIGSSVVKLNSSI
jgi:four helix bundle protein